MRYSFLKSALTKLRSMGIFDHVIFDRKAYESVFFFTYFLKRIFGRIVPVLIVCAFLAILFLGWYQSPILSMPNSVGAWPSEAGILLKFLILQSMIIGVAGAALSLILLRILSSFYIPDSPYSSSVSPLIHSGIDSFTAIRPHFYFHFIKYHFNFIKASFF